MMDLDRDPKDPKWVAAIAAIFAMLATAMGGAYAFTSSIARDYVSMREFDRTMNSIDQHLNRMEQHLDSVDSFVHGRGDKK